MNQPPPIIQSSSTTSSSAPRRRPWGWIVLALAAMALLAVSLLGNALLGSLVTWSPLFEDDSRATVFRETRIGGDAGAKEKVAVIYVQDLISFSAPGYSGEEGMVGDIKEQLVKASRDENVKAIIVAIDSPGGEVTASDVIHHAIVTAKKKNGVPVVASLGPLAASGGYYVATGADWIVAHRTTLTGSIGVIFHLWNYRGLMDKVGVKPIVYKSGKMKDMLSPEKLESEITAEEKEVAQRLVMSDYDRFIEVVAEGRRMKAAELKAGLADGRVLSGEEALKHKFVDQLGYFEDAVAKAKSLAKIETAKLVKYEALWSMRKLLSLFAESRWPLKLPGLAAGQADFRLENGRFYYLPGGWLE
ncbi:MAG: signal peptide peptidase SppA [Verrucomicrobia bacterium]|nr:signal peptide peptidase SppA [Verrucomicrobiota bacterium]